MSRKLTLVACHAVFLDPAGDSYAGGFPEEGALYLAHARRGVELAGRGLLLFSGGATQRDAGVRTEARSYLEVARYHGWWGHPELEHRTLTEDYARDSFENLLFSLARFREHTGADPDSITVVGWRFKAERFALHCAGAGWPAERFHYEGVNDPADAAGARAREARVRALFAQGAKHPEVEAKRRSRDPFGRAHPYRLDW